MSKGKRACIVIAVVALVIAGATTASLLVARRPGISRARLAAPPEELAVADAAPAPSVWIDVRSPALLRQALRSNAWLSRVQAAPLGRGLAGGWGPFLASRGGDVGGGLRGAVGDLVLDALLADPFRVVLYTGEGATGAPAVLVPDPSAKARRAFELLEQVAAKSALRAPRCPGPAPADPAKATPVLVSRWVVAEQPLFAAELRGRIALGKNPLVTLQALCAPPPVTSAGAAQGADVTLAFAPAALGREAQLAAALLGLGSTPRLAFALQGDRLVPRGLADDLAEPGRLDAAAPPADLLHLVPADAGVVLTATLRLPAPLTRASLAEHLGGTYHGQLSPRSIALVWNPRGARQDATEVALLWPNGDEELLAEAFSGPNRLERRSACGHVVLASSADLATAVAGACSGARPSMLNSTPAVVDGLRQRASVAVGVQLGQVLSRVLADGWGSENTTAPPPEIDAARRLLEELPFFGLRGVADGRALVPGGFRS